MPGPVWRIQSRGVLQAIDGAYEVTPGTRTRHLPGHTPGHQVLHIEDGAASLLLSGDAIDRPRGCSSPSWPAGPTRMPKPTGVRRRLIAELVDTDRVLAPAHFAEPFGRVVSDGPAGRISWLPIVWSGQGTFAYDRGASRYGRPSEKSTPSRRIGLSVLLDHPDDPTGTRGSVWVDEASNLSRPDPTDQMQHRASASSERNTSNKASVSRELTREGTDQGHPGSGHVHCWVVVALMVAVAGCIARAQAKAAPRTATR